MESSHEETARLIRRVVPAVCLGFLVEKKAKKTLIL